jgi:hypothetical protein
MVNQENTNNQLEIVPVLYKNYKTFRDFLRFPPCHFDIDPEYPGCGVFLDIESIDNIKRESNGSGYVYKIFTVNSRCLYHNDRIYRYRAIIKMTYIKK